MRFTGLKVCLLALIVGGVGVLYAQNPQPVPPDCVIFINNWTTAQSSASFSNYFTACQTWTFQYTSVGFTGLTITVQSAPAATPTTPGSFVTYAGTVSTGINPNTNTSGRVTTFANGLVDIPWIRVNLSGLTGTGTVFGVLYGYKTGYAGSGGGGSGGAVTCGVAAFGVCYNNAGAFASDTNLTWQTFPANPNANPGQFALGIGADPFLATAVSNIGFGMKSSLTPNTYLWTDGAGDGFSTFNFITAGGTFASPSDIGANTQLGQIANPTYFNGTYNNNPVSLLMRTDTPAPGTDLPGRFEVLVKTTAGATQTYDFQSTQTIFPLPFTIPILKTTTNCADSAGAAACGAAPAGHFVVDAGNTTVVVSTTAVTANSEITIFPDKSLSALLGITCNTAVPPTVPQVSARTAGTSFTLEVSAPVTNPACFGYTIVN